MLKFGLIQHYSSKQGPLDSTEWVSMTLEMERALCETLRFRDHIMKGNSMSLLVI